jgi:hypothetical protein
MEYGTNKNGRCRVIIQAGRIYRKQVLAFLALVTAAAIGCLISWPSEAVNSPLVFTRRWSQPLCYELRIERLPIRVLILNRVHWRILMRHFLDQRTVSLTRVTQRFLNYLF